MGLRQNKEGIGQEFVKLGLSPSKGLVQLKVVLSMGKIGVFILLCSLSGLPTSTHSFSLLKGKYHFFSICFHSMTKNNINILILLIVFFIPSHTFHVLPIPSHFYKKNTISSHQFLFLPTLFSFFSPFYTRCFPTKMNRP